MLMAAALLSAGIGAASNVAQNYFNSQANKEARQWQYQMWMKNNEYNTPQNQVARLRAAGLNPGIAMSNGAVGSGTSSSPAEGVEPMKYDFSPAATALQQGAMLHIENKKADAEIREKNSNAQGQEIRNQWLNFQELADLLNKRSDLKKKGKDTDLVDQMIEYKRQENAAFQERNAAEVQRIRAEAAEKEKQAHLVELQSSYQEIINKYAPKEKAKLLSQIDANTQMLLSAAYEHDKAALSHAADVALKGVDLETKKAIKPFLINEAESKANESYWNSERAAKIFLLGDKGSYWPAMDLNGHSYESYNTGFRGDRVYNKEARVSRKRHPRHSIQLQ